MADAPADPVARYLRAGTLMLRALPPLSLYVHLPWCLKKCPYCDFNSHEQRGDQRSRYLDALRADLDASLPAVWGRRVISVFIGGGTPSLFEPAQIEALIADIRARLPLDPGCEITLEANPGTFERERFAAYRAAGVTRLSIGVQSFSDAALGRIGRVHDAAQAHAACDEAARTFEHWNIDLMYALPGQDEKALDADLDAALAHGSPHLSIYHLTIEANTLFAKHRPELPDDDTASRMLDRIVERTAGVGLQRYEVSAFAKPGARCAHNLNYWQFGDYLGIGAGAHGKLSFPHRIVRQVRYRDPDAYQANALAGRAIAQDDEVPRAQLPFEFMLNALRLRDGIELDRFSERTGLPASAIEAPLGRAVARGLIEREGPLIRPTARGYDFLNDAIELFLAPARA